MREQFAISDFPHLYVAEGFAPCGCGFPEALPGRKLRTLAPEERATMERLGESLRPALRARPRVRLLLCFIGQEHRPEVPGRTVTLTELMSPEFRFRNLEMVTVLRRRVE